MGAKICGGLERVGENETAAWDSAGEIKRGDQRRKDEDEEGVER